MKTQMEINEQIPSFIFSKQVSSEYMEAAASKIIEAKKLGRNVHPFFVFADEYQKTPGKTISVRSAFEMARHWEIMTKTFMFSTLSSLAKLSESLEQSADPSNDVLKALQTGVKVISDDLNNNHPVFARFAPAGPDGIHYKWWRKDVVFPLADKLFILSWDQIPLSENIAKLIAGMQELAREPFGFAVQLRVVEAIALHIAMAFHKILIGVEHQGQKIYGKRSALAWITAHIQAEVTHHSQVTDTQDGMSYVATNVEEQHQFLATLDWYSELWSHALNDFYVFMNTVTS